jgi:predicted DCC family thiol-disulfide oxidoreductase YuxK
MQARTGIAYLLYDADCGPCTRFKKLVKDLDLMHKIKPVPLQRRLAYQLVQTRMTREDMMRSMHIVYLDPRSVGYKDESRIFTGGDALMELIRLLPVGTLLYRPMKRHWFLRKFVRRTYTFMTKLRKQSKSCAVFD